MRRRMSWLIGLVLMLNACIDPEVRLFGEMPIDVRFPIVEIDLDVLWDYSLHLGGEYDWESEWTYGWDAKDQKEWGDIGYTEPTAFELRRYYLGSDPTGRHYTVDPFFVTEPHFRAKFDLGYYDLLAWNDIDAVGGVQSIRIDETSTLDSIVAYTGVSPYGRNMGQYVVENNQTYYMPDALFAGQEAGLHVSNRAEDYDYYDAATNTYYLYANLELRPVTYIYLTQVRLHNNKGRIVNSNGTANLSGMARAVCLNSGRSSDDAIVVNYQTRFKQGLRTQEGEEVDVVGGRCMCFGLPGQNNSTITRTEDVNSVGHCLMDMHFVFSNDMDSTIVFDVTDQVRERYKGGVITIDLDVDSVPMPTREGGSAFNAEVLGFEREDHVIEI